MTEKLATGPCLACPYRRDVASGVWHSDEYEKLPLYDGPTASQPIAAFMCHAELNNYCFGWVVCHSNRGHDHELLALRLRGFGDLPGPQPGFFKSGRQACRHGKNNIEQPTAKSVVLAEKLLMKYKRLRHEN